MPGDRDQTIRLDEETAGIVSESIAAKKSGASLIFAARGAASPMMLWRRTRIADVAVGLPDLDERTLLLGGVLGRRCRLYAP